jgi:hypothetical protein
MYSSLRVIAPPAVEPISLDEARQHLRLDSMHDDDLVTQLVTSARSMVEMHLGRVLITQTLLWTMSQDPPSGALPLLPMPLLVLPVILSAPQIMNKPLELPRCPVQSVSGVTHTSMDGTVETLAPTDYTVDLALDPARLRLHWATVPRYMQHIQVTFVAGYGPAGSDVPAPILAAIKLWLAFLYEQRGDSSDAAGNPPRAIEWLLAPYKIQFFA